ncbi:adenine deaminase [Treponema ruminis]|uniref:Adenine deaminase n=1 Tax=Treponema ruminis TaxID=744515 RepID=A0A7W8LMD4_9SPIR|nr:adenine deaminase [Treponema ruminis]MBB5226399.1 adenine deaminase [Treponema ruminis]QSI02696.1 adenine deaminase [Treponema ruminis]
MDKASLTDIIKSAKGEEKADLVIKNCHVVNVFSSQIIKADIAIRDGVIAGIGSYSGKSEIDAAGAYAIPGLIESHIHIESSFVTPEEFGRMAVPLGTTTVIADPHEITNVCGLKGFFYMMEAAKNTALDIKFMVPSCVPATPFEDSGAVLNSEEIEKVINNPDVLGLGELMNYPGVLNCDDEVLNKILLAKKYNKIIDGHAPGVVGLDRQAYISCGVKTDHECSTIQEMQESLQNGMYVELRDGSACHDLENLIPGITKENSRRLLLCSDDRQPVTFHIKGDINNHLKLCVSKGIDPITAIQMGSLNAAECYRLYDRGALAPGLRADIVLVGDLKNFEAKKVFIQGELVAEDGKYLKEVKRASISDVSGSVKVAGFSRERLTVHLADKKSKCRVHVIEISPGSIVTKNSIEEVTTDEEGNFLHDPEKDISKIAVIERHHKSGNIGLGLLKNYGIKDGAIAITIAHDSHNIICVGTDDAQMETAVKALIEQKGGIVLVSKNKVIERLELPVAGLMSDRDADWVQEKLAKINQAAFEILGINREIEPVSTLCFMALPVIPEIKITDKGLFDVKEFKFIDILD